MSYAKLTYTEPASFLGYRSPFYVGGLCDVNERMDVDFRLRKNASHEGKSCHFHTAEREE
jgi:hypothetical protein